MTPEQGFLMDELTWGQRVKMVRLKLNCTQVQLAERLSMSSNALALWETRSDRPYSAESERFLQLEAALEDGEVS